MGFRGQFQDLPTVERPIYDLVQEGKSGFYYPVPEDKSILSDDNVSALVTESNDTLYSTGRTAARSSIVQGTAENADGKHVLQLGADGKIRLAFSPNGDGNQDNIQYRTVLYRNINNLTASVYTADDKDYRFPIWQSSTIREGRRELLWWSVRQS